MRYALIIAVAAAAAGCAEPPRTDPEKRARIEDLYAGYREEFPDVPEITARELMEKKTSDEWVVLDARTPEEIAVSRIPGAVPKDAFEAHPDRYEGKQVVVYCTIGYRSAECAGELRQAGVDAVNLKGSILSWLHAGGEVVDESGEPVKRVHVYGAKWDLAPEGYETTTF